MTSKADLQKEFLAELKEVKEMFGELESHYNSLINKPSYNEVMNDYKNCNIDDINKVYFDLSGMINGINTEASLLNRRMEKLKEISEKL